MVEEGPVAGLLVALEEREVDHPVEDLVLGRELELASEVDSETAEDACDRRLVTGCEEHRRARLASERLELALRQELRDRRPHLVSVVHEIRETLRSPLLRDLLEPLQLGPRERLWRDEEAHGLGVREDPELGPACRLRRVLDLEPEPEVRLVRAVLPECVRVREPRERALRRVPAERLEGADDHLLQHVEHIFALDERQLEVELPELELPVGAQVLVPPAGRDLVVAIEPADHAELLEDLRRLREREEAARLKADGHDEVTSPLRRPARHARRPHVDEPEPIHRVADRRDHRVREAQVPLHPRRAHVEPAVPEAQRLVHALLVELERERRRARDDLELVDLELDLAGRHRRVDRLGRARDDLPARAEDELVPDLLRRLGRLGRVLGVDDELRHAGVVAQVDEDEPTVVAACVHPATESQRLPDVLGPRVAAHEIAPAHCDSLPGSSSWVTSSSGLPGRRMVARRWSTTTIIAAPRRPACVSWPFSERCA